MIEALRELDKLLNEDVTLIVGGGGAMILAHKFFLSTMDIDAYPKQANIGELDVLIKKVAEKLKIPFDWLNMYYSTFSHVLPDDYGKRLINVFSGNRLQALALGLDDLLIMKCFAGRIKDISHAKALIKKGADVEFVDEYLESLEKNNLPGADKALEFLDELRD